MASLVRNNNAVTISKLEIVSYKVSTIHVEIVSLTSVQIYRKSTLITEVFPGMKKSCQNPV